MRINEAQVREYEKKYDIICLDKYGNVDKFDTIMTNWVNKHPIITGIIMLVLFLVACYMDGTSV